jgi:hypothetical protein
MTSVRPTSWVAAAWAAGVALAMGAASRIVAQDFLQSATLEGRSYQLRTDRLVVVDTATSQRVAEVALPGGTGVALAAASLATEGLPAATDASRTALVVVVTAGEPALMVYDEKARRGAARSRGRSSGCPPPFFSNWSGVRRRSAGSCRSEGSTP